MDRCPRRLILDDPGGFGQALNYYSMYDKGVLLKDGALEDQPYAYVELMTVIRSAIGMLEADQREKMSKSTNSKSGVNARGGNKR